jgi:hypothetical protein
MNGARQRSPKRVIDDGGGSNPVKRRRFPVVWDGQYALEEGKGDMAHFVSK